MSKLSRQDKKRLIKELGPNLAIIFLFLLIGLFVWNKSHDSQQVVEQLEASNKQLLSGYTQELEKKVEKLQNEIDNIGSKIEYDKQGFVLNSNDCSFTYTGGYKFLDIFEEDYTPSSENPSVNNYTKPVNVTGDIEEVHVCVLADVGEDHKGYGDYLFSVWAYLGNGNNAGYINVGYSPATDRLYDNSSPNARNKSLYGRFDGSETPFKQVIDLEKVTIADLSDGNFYKYIRPITNFVDGNSIRLGGYLDADTHYYTGKIKQFRVIYRGSGELSIAN